MNSQQSDRKQLLKKTAETYFESLKNKNFSAMPFSDDIVFRAPLAPGGAHNPLVGKQVVLEKWWKPLEPALDKLEVTIIGHYYDDALAGVITKADITIPAINTTLRTADRFVINEAGQITEQENHFDASSMKSYIHHICLRSMDFRKTREFYQNVLGFPVAIDTNDLIIFVAGSVFLAFKKAEPRDAAYNTFSPFEVGLDHIAIACDSEDELHRFAEKLNNAQVDNTGVKLDSVLNKLYVAFKDPDKIAWEFYMK